MANWKYRPNCNSENMTGITEESRGLISTERAESMLI